MSLLIPGWRLGALSLILSAGTLLAVEVKPLRALLICGGCCHDYDNQKQIIAEGLKARAHIEVDAVQQGGTTTNTKIPVYENPDWAKGYDIIIHDECFSDVKEPAWTAGILKPHKEGLPAVVLHCAMHSYRDGTEEWFKFLGVTSWGHGAHYPHEVLTRDATHPIMQTLGPGWWNPAGELYNVTKFWPTAHALASSKNQENGKEEICVWVNNYHEGTRVFGTTLGHHNETVSSGWHLDLLTRGTLWAAGKLESDYLKQQEAKLVPVNLAKGRKATASSEQEGHPAKDAVDGTGATRWCANGSQSNEWLQIDLGSPAKINSTRIDWEMADPVYRYKIESSLDGKDWTALVDGSENKRPGITEDPFSPRELRYVRVTFLGSSTGSWGSINELQLFGDKTEPVQAGDLAREKEKALLAEVKVPEDFETTIFAAPPTVNYPVFVAAAADGTLYVSSDKNGSIDRGPRRGRVLRVRDVNNDGRADEVKMFVPDVDSPRGLVWDRDRLYLLHPPHLSAFIDHDGDGISDEQKILVKNIAFTFKDRPADHSSNGIELGVDGWIYCAIGDFGFMEAEGTDGRKLQLRAGGVVRVRPDGTGLELYSRGTRNILEVAVSPTLDMFARDNTNDGDGWDIRLHHFTPLSEHGYPSLYKNFKGDFVEPLADYGGGSGCGGMFLSEPGFPSQYNDCIYTADWGREWIYRHKPTPKGATFTVDQHEFLRAPRVTDLDVDASSRIYAASWKGASFTYVGEEVGFIVRATPKGYSAPALPDFKKLNPAELIAQLESPSHRRRLEAQREMLARPLDKSNYTAIKEKAESKSAALPTRVAAIFLLKQKWGASSHLCLSHIAEDPAVASFVVRALADNTGQLENVPEELLVQSLKSDHAPLRREAAFALARLGKPAHATPLAELLADSDAVVAHTTVQSLRRLQATEPIFAVIDDAAAPSAKRQNAFRVLQALHQPEVVAGLVKRLSAEQNAERRRGLITTLARLHFMEGPWKGDSWGTRPDTTGPYYQPAEWSESPQIAGALKESLARATGDEAAFIVTELARHKIQSSDTLDTVVRLASADDSLLPAALSQLARADRPPDSALPLLNKAAAAESSAETTRAQAIVALAKFNSADVLAPMLSAMTQFERNRGSRDAQSARQALLRWRAADQHHEQLAREAARLDGNRSAWADALLIALAERQNASPESRAAAKQALDSGWNDNPRRAQILRAVALAEQRSWKDKVLEAAASPDTSVSEAARHAARALRIEKELENLKPAAPVKTIADLSTDDVLAAVQNLKGDLKVGEEIFTRQGCNNCHTTSASDPLRGPFLGNIATIYKRRELTEAVLVPNKSIAQGFVAHQFALKDGEEIEGFVIQEAADKVTIRNVAAQEIIIPTGDIASRKKIEKSLMPEGLAANLTPKELASLIDYLQALAK